ncbi:MAG: tRNA epoxyqueuosine(34) reductase QueG [Candidatus Eremiobacteraeota bacterium]|nr:tRNA epoxyqueuosine(34) reductase QueG [Candidatus Eremiobacteraeota bacterium]
MKDRSQLSNAELATIKRRAVDRARELGAVSVRVAPAFPDEATRDAMRAAFVRGDFTTWKYDEEYARRAASPDAILPGARSVICIAVPYATAPPQRAPLTGRVSNYAWSIDYHRRMKALLADVASAIEEIAGEGTTAIACDTKPLAERAFAARAGIGWVGKHTNLIVPASGSFVFLGEIATTLLLQADEPLRKSCGSCRRCIAACPTGALRGDYTIDATRCISDLTQRTDALPYEMRALMGTWVWGCDICQDVCPPTKNAGPTGVVQNAPASRDVAAPDLIKLLTLRSSEFKRTYAKTAMGWRGAAVLRRNAAVALGNALDRSTVPALISSLGSDPHPLVRGHVAWALGRIGSPAALTALSQAGTRETDDYVTAEITQALEPYVGPAR